MAHLNLYLPDDVAAVLKRDADAAKVPLSKYVASLLAVQGPGNRWPNGYFERVCGFLSEEMVEPADPLPEPLEALDLNPTPPARRR